VQRSSKPSPGKLREAGSRDQRGGHRPAVHRARRRGLHIVPVVAGNHQERQAWPARARLVNQAAAERVARSAADPVAAEAEAQAELVKTQPAAVDDVLASGGARKTVSVIDRLQLLGNDLELLIKHGKKPDGGVRNSSLLLQATGEFRKLLETAARIRATMTDAAEIEPRHEAVLDEIGRCDPELHLRVLRRLRIWRQPGEIEGRRPVLCRRRRRLPSTARIRRPSA
jgi:hypothetical protein